MDIQEFINDLNSPDVNVRLYALKGVKSLGKEGVKAIPVLMRLIRKETAPEIRLRLVAAVGAIAMHDDRGIEALVRILAERSRMVFSTAILVLERIGARAVPHLVRALSHRNYFVRSGAAGALARIKGPGTAQALPVLLDLLENDEKMSVRASAAFAIGKIAGGSREVVESLVRAARDPEWRVRDFAVSSGCTAAPTWKRLFPCSWKGSTTRKASCGTRPCPPCPR